MQRFIIFRLVYAVLVIIAVSMLVFGLSRSVGDPRTIYLSDEVTQEQYEAWGRQMGLDKPLAVQYVIWLSKAARGDLGKSLRYQIPVASVVWQRIPATVELGVSAFVLAVLMGVSLGVLSAVRRGSLWDYLGRTFALLGQALPTFWTGLLFILVFAVWLGWLPTGRRGGMDHLILPAITLSWALSAGLLRLTRSAMLEVLDSEYVKLARAKGVSARRVVWKHAFRNAVIPPLTFAGLMLAGFIGGAVVTEVIFAWPGVGRLALQSILQNDTPLMIGIVLMGAAVYLVVNFFIDIAYAYIDPRIRY